MNYYKLTTICYILVIMSLLISAYIEIISNNTIFMKIVSISLICSLVFLVVGILICGYKTKDYTLFNPDPFVCLAFAFSWGFTSVILIFGTYDFFGIAFLFGAVSYFLNFLALKKRL